MSIDAGIYGQIGRGVKSVADYDQQYAQLDAAKQAREMGALNLLMGKRQIASQDRALADQEALRSLVSGFGTDDAANEQALIRAGRLPEAQAYRKSALDAAKDKEEAAFKRSQIRENDDKIVGTSLQRYRDALSTIQTPDDYVRHLKAQYDDPVIGPIVQRMGGDFMTAASRIPTDPAAFQQYVQRSAMGMDKFIADQTTRANAKLSSDTQLTTNRLTNETSRANNQATVGATIRGQNMTDARAREANASGNLTIDADRGLLVDRRTGETKPIMADGKPVGPKSAGGAASESERTAGFLLQRIRDSQRQLSTAIEKDPDAAKPGVLQEGVRKISEPAANTLTGSGRQRVEAAQLDILDAALTLGTGAAYTREQLEGYRKSYFPQIGDGKEAVADKEARLQNLIRAAETKAGRMAKDTAPPPADQPPGKPVNVKSDAEYNALPSGATFVGPDGKTRRKP